MNEIFISGGWAHLRENWPVASGVCQESSCEYTLCINYVMKLCMFNDTFRYCTSTNFHKDQFSLMAHETLFAN